ncbi:hypothetical protein ACLMJK_007342 [Lecanora helva]
MSREVHRIGYHFPSVVVDEACMTLGVTLTASGRVVQSKFALIDEQAAEQRKVDRASKKKKSKVKKQNGPQNLDISLSQAVIDTQAREAIRDLFPKIPPEDLHTIIGRAFQKGKGLVGTVGNLSLVRRAQLAVTAHIRHEYTKYDQILKSTGWGDARKQVEQACLDVLVQWRGDDDEDGELEDILREVIVISDDEDENEKIRQDPATLRGYHERSPSVQVISADALHTQSINYAATDPSRLQGRSASSDTDDWDEEEYIGAAPSLRNQPTQYNQQRLEQMGAHRQRMWEQAVNRQQKPLQPGDSRHRPPFQPRFEDFNQHQSQHVLQQARSYEAERPHPGRPQEHINDRLVALPFSGTEIIYDNGSLGQRLPYSTEQGTESRQVIRSSHSHHSAPETVGKKPVPVYYAREPETLSPPVYYDRTPTIENPLQEKRFVEHAALHHEKAHSRYDAYPQMTMQHRPELALPSIEGDFLNASDQQSPVYRYAPGAEPFKRRRDDGMPLQQVAPLPVRSAVEEDLQPSKRRRVDSPRLADNWRQIPGLASVRIGEDNAEKCPRWTRNVHDGVTSPQLLDKRIIRLPPREPRHHESAGPQSHLLLKGGRLSDENVHDMSLAHSHARYSLPDYSGQSQFHRHSTAFRPVYENDSLIRSDTSAYMQREFLDANPSSSSTLAPSNPDGGAYQTLQMARRPLPQFVDIREDVPRQFEDLAIGPSSDAKNRSGVRFEREVYISPHEPGIIYKPMRTDQAAQGEFSGERRYQSVHNDALTLSSMQQSRIGESVYGRNNHDIVTQRQMDCEQAGSLPRRQNYPLSNVTNRFGSE